MNERLKELERELEQARAANRQLLRRLETKRERIRVLEQRSSQSDKLQTMGAFVASVVHDMNNVLSVMMSAQRIVARKLKDDVPKDLFENVETSVEKGQRLLRQLLDFSRTDDLEPALADPAAMLARDEALMKQLVGGTVSLDLTLPEERWEVFCEPGRLMSVMFNMLSNARDAIRETGRRGEVSVRVENVSRGTADAHHDYVCLSVKDNGKGIPASLHKHFGEAFFTTKPKGQGTGIGLRSAYDLARRCGGMVEIDSEEDVGTEIRIYLARAVQRGALIEMQGSREDLELHGRSRVLIVVPSEELAEGLERVLGRLGYGTGRTATPESARSLMKDDSDWDMLLFDLDENREQAVTMITELRADRTDLHVLAIASHGQSEQPVQVIPKPVSEHALSRALLEQFDRLPGISLTDRVLDASARVRDRLDRDEMRQAFDLWYDRVSRGRFLPDAGLVGDLQDCMDDHACLIACDQKDGSGAPVLRIVWAGNALEARYGGDLNNVVVSEETLRAIGPMAPVVRRCRRGAAFADHWQGPATDGGQTSALSRLVLPLAEGGESVTHLFGIMH